MTATYPIVEQIAMEIVDRLEAITIANGYQVNIAEVLRPTRIGNVGQLGYATKDLLAVVEQSTRTAIEQTDGNPSAIAMEQVFLVALYRTCSTNETVPIDTKINVFQADAEKALTLGLTPTANWQQFVVGGDHLAINARLGDPTYFNLIDSQAAGVTIPLAVTYRTPINDPYTAIS